MSKFMTRATWRGVAAAAAVATVFVGGPATAQGKDGPYEFVFSGGNPGGTFNIIVTAIVERLKQDHPGTQIDITPGGSLTNTIRLGRGDQSVSMLTSMLPTRGYAGVTPPEQFAEPFKAIRGVAKIYNMHSQFIVPADSDLQSFDEVVEKKLPIKIVPGGPRGNVGVTVMQDLLKDAYGMTLEDMEGWGADLVFADYNQASQMMKDGQVDMIMTLTAAPNGAFLDLANSKDVRFLPIKDATAKAMLDSGYVQADMPANTYPGQDTPVPAVSLTASIYARDDAPEGVVRAVTKAVLAADEYLVNVHRRVKEDFKAETAHQGLGVPLHPEAEAVYKEMGYLK